MEAVLSSALISYGVLLTLLSTCGFITNSPYVYGDGILQVSHPILADSLSLVCHNIACQSKIEASIQCERAAECWAFYYNPATPFCPICKCGDYSTRRSFSPDGQVHLRLLEVDASIPGNLMWFYSRDDHGVIYFCLIYIYRYRYIYIYKYIKKMHTSVRCILKSYHDATIKPAH